MINCLQSSDSVTRISLNLFKVPVVVGVTSSWKKVPSSMDKLLDAAFASSSASKFSALGPYFNVKPWTFTLRLSWLLGTWPISALVLSTPPLVLLLLESLSLQVLFVHLVPSLCWVLVRGLHTRLCCLLPWMLTWMHTWSGYRMVISIQRRF